MLLIVFLPPTLIAVLGELRYPDFGSDVTKMSFAFAITIALSLIFVFFGSVLINIKISILHRNKLAHKVMESYSSAL